MHQMFHLKSALIFFSEVIIFCEYVNEFDFIQYMAFIEFQFFVIVSNSFVNYFVINLFNTYNAVPAKSFLHKPFLH